MELDVSNSEMEGTRLMPEVFGIVGTAVYASAAPPARLNLGAIFTERFRWIVEVFGVLGIVLGVLGVLVFRRVGLNRLFVIRKRLLGLRLAARSIFRVALAKERLAGLRARAVAFLARLPKMPSERLAALRTLPRRAFVLRDWPWFLEALFSN